MAKEFPVKVKLSAIDKITAPMDRLTNAFPKFDRAIKKSAQAIRIFDKETEKLSKDFKSIGGKMQSVGATMTAAFTLPVIAGTALSINAFREYQTALIGVGKTSNLQGAELDALGKQFIDMSKRIPISSTELMALGQSAAQLGVKGTDNILKFSETLAKLSKSSNVVGEEGAAQLARLINSTGGNLSDVDRLASSIVDLGNNFAVTEAEILEFGTRLGSSTALFNVSAQDALGIATALKSVGIQAELGSSAVQRGFLGINKAIGSGGAKLKALSMVTGIAADELKERFAKDSVGVFQSFTKGLGRLGDEGKDVTKVLKYFGLEGVGNVQVLGALAKGNDNLTKALDMSRKAFEDNIALNREFAQFAGSLDSKIQLAKNSFTALAISIGKFLAPALEVLLSVFTSIADFLAGHPVFTTILLGIGGILAVIGPLLLAFGTFLVMWPGIAAGLTAMGFATTGYAAAAGGALLTTGLLVGKLALLAAAFTAAYAAGSWLADNTFVGKIGEAIADLTEGDPEAEGAASVQAGIKRRRGLEANTKVNRELIQKTNNARVDINVRAPQSTSIVSESDNGMLSVNRGMVGAW